MQNMLLRSTLAPNTATQNTPWGNILVLWVEDGGSIPALRAVLYIYTDKKASQIWSILELLSVSVSHEHGLYFGAVTWNNVTAWTEPYRLQGEMHKSPKAMNTPRETICHDQNNHKITEWFVWKMFSCRDQCTMQRLHHKRLTNHVTMHVYVYYIHHHNHTNPPFCPHTLRTLPSKQCGLYARVRLGATWAEDNTYDEHVRMSKNSHSRIHFFI